MIYLMRHGEDDENYIGGWSNVSLTPTGIQKTTEQGYWLKENLNITNILTSDIKRAVETASIISQILNIPYETTLILREQNKGLLNGLPKTIATRLYPTYTKNITTNTIYPKGESLQMLYNRIITNLNIFQNLPPNTLLITHRGVINIIYYYLHNLSLDMNKEQFHVTHSSLHELDLTKKLIRRIN